MLTLSMIVKNEEKYLEDCLESVKNIVDEIVIVDTGSSDATLQIAEKFNSKIYSFDWVNDFSLARNFALSKSQGDWILYLDADERLSPNSVDIVRNIVKHKNETGYYCTIKNIDKISGDSIIKNIRLFNNHPKLKFEGKIHENIELSLLNNRIKLKNSEIVIEHLGYNISTEEKIEKAKRNMPLLLSEYESSKTAYYAIKIGSTYKFVKDNENAKKYFLQALEFSNITSVQKAKCFTSLAQCYYDEGSINEATNYIIESEREYKYEPYTFYLHSKICLSGNNPKTAVEKTKQAFELQSKIEKGMIESENLFSWNYWETINYSLSLSIKTKDDNDFKYYLIKYLELINQNVFSNKDKFTASVNKLITSKSLTSEDINVIVENINGLHINIIVNLLSIYTNSESKVALLKKLVNKSANRVQVLKEIIRINEITGNIDDSITLIEENFDLFESEPSIYFLLISYYVRNQKTDKTVYTISLLENKYNGNDLMVNKLESLKKLLNPLVN